MLSDVAVRNSIFVIFGGPLLLVLIVYVAFDIWGRWRERRERE